MLQIITGLPGNGKTLYTLDLVQKYQAAQHADALKVDPEAKPRPVYQLGITDLSWDWQKLERVERWFELPTGAIIVIDEAQRHFPVMSVSAKRPDHYLRFDMHRHQGHDIFLITQDSQLIDSQVRAMSGKHAHLVRPFGMEYSNVYEWSVVTNTRNKNVSKDTDAIKSKWTFRKELYDVYKSAEAHTHKRDLPWKKLVGIGVALVLPVVLIIYALSWVGNRSGDDSAEVDQANSENQILSASGGAGGVFGNLDSWTPAVDDIPMSAPIYAGIARIVDAPRVTGCMLLDFGDSVDCSCTDQQGNGVAVSETFCKAFVDRGSFDPTQGQSRRVSVADRS